MRNTMPKTIALLAGGALLAAGTAHADRSEWPTNFTVGTASQGGTYFVYGSGWANFIADELGVSGGGEVTGGPPSNGQRVRAVPDVRDSVLHRSALELWHYFHL